MVYSVRPAYTERYSAIVEWDFDGKRHRKYFPSAAKAKAWADIKNTEARNEGVNALTFPEELRIEAGQCNLRCRQFGKSLKDAVDLATKAWETESRSIKVKDAMDSLLKEKKAEGKAKRYLLDIDYRLRTFEEDFKDRLLSSITAMEIKDWLFKVSSSNVSRNNFYRVLSVLFKFALFREWISEDPMKKFKKLDEPKTRIEVLTPGEAERLLDAAPEEVKAHIAVGLFAGLRRCELILLTPESVRWSSKIIAASEEEVRGAAKRHIKMRPCLQAWLKQHPLRYLQESEFNKAFAKAIDDAGLRPWKDNGLRHSFCSYSLEHEKDLNTLTYEMGHTNPHTLFKHYRELVTPEDAAKYWRIGLPSRKGKGNSSGIRWSRKGGKAGGLPRAQSV